nr:MAG TPA: hypothetical protein [Caudoviricetes sp.]
MPCIWCIAGYDNTDCWNHHGWGYNDCLHYRGRTD